MTELERLEAYRTLGWHLPETKWERQYKENSPDINDKMMSRGKGEFSGETEQRFQDYLTKRYRKNI